MHNCRLSDFSAETSHRRGIMELLDDQSATRWSVGAFESLSGGHSAVILYLLYKRKACSSV